MRWPDTVADSREIARLEGEVQHLKDEILRLQGEHVRLGEKLELAETKLCMAADSRWLNLGNRIGLGPRLR